MVVAAVVGNQLVGVDDLEEAYRTRGTALDEFLAQEEPDTGFTLNITGERALAYGDLDNARAAASGTVPFQPIGLGRPLTITIETVYVGNYPDTMPWVPWIDGGDILVSSGHKAFQNFEAAPRAVHLLESKVKRKALVEPDAVHQGSKMVYYTPAVTDVSTLFTVEVSADREFNAALGESFAKAVSAAGALPVFAPAAPYLVAAGVAIPLAWEAVNLLARPRTFFEETVEINFGLAGIERTQARALVLYPGSDTDSFARFKLGKGNLLRDGNGDAYSGDLPYVVLSLDGADHPELEGWTSQAATAVLLDRFFKRDELMSKALTLAGESLSLYNDMTYRQRALDELEAAQGSKGDVQQQHLRLYEAYTKNIQNDAIRGTVV